MANPVFHSQYTAAQIEGLIGHGVPILRNGTWWRWDIVSGDYVDTGIIADSETAAAVAVAAQEAAEAAQAAAESARNAAEDAMEGAETAQHAAENAQEAAEDAAASIPETAHQALEAFYHKLAQGATVEIADGADEIPVRSASAVIVATQAGSGTASPTNPRLISGETERDFYWHGKLAILSQPVNFVGNVGDEVNFVVVAYGEGLTYQWQYSSNGGNNWFNSTLAGGKTDTLSMEFTTARLVYVFRCIVTDASGEHVITNPVRLVVVGTTPEPINPNYDPWEMPTIEVEYGQEAFGGDYDFQNHVLTLNKLIVLVKNLTWSYSSATKCFRAQKGDFPVLFLTNGQEDALCSHYNVVTASGTSDMAADGRDKCICVGSSGISTNYAFYVRDDSFDGDATDFKASMGDVQIVFDIVPMQVEVLPEEEAIIKTHLGVNRFFSGHGVVKIDYRADLTTIISGLATTEYVANAINAAIGDAIGGSY